MSRGCDPHVPVGMFHVHITCLNPDLCPVIPSMRTGQHDVWSLRAASAKCVQSPTAENFAEDQITALVSWAMTISFLKKEIGVLPVSGPEGNRADLCVFEHAHLDGVEWTLDQPIPVDARGFLWVEAHQRIREWLPTPLSGSALKIKGLQLKVHGHAARGAVQHKDHSGLWNYPLTLMGDFTPGNTPYLLMSSPEILEIVRQGTQTFGQVACRQAEANDHGRLWASLPKAIEARLEELDPGQPPLVAFLPSRNNSVFVEAIAFVAMLKEAGDSMPTPVGVPVSGTTTDEIFMLEGQDYMGEDLRLRSRFVRCQLKNLTRGRISLDRNISFPGGTRAGQPVAEVRVEFRTYYMNNLTYTLNGQNKPFDFVTCRAMPLSAMSKVFDE